MNYVTINGFGRYRVRKGKILLDLLIEKSVPITASCGGRGRCGLCRMKIIGKIKPPDIIESSLIPQKLLEQGYRLACRHKIEQNITVIAPMKKRKKSIMSTPSGLALDIGTTVIKGAALNFETERIKKTKIFNLQNNMGGDIITRISEAINGKYTRLRRLLQKSIEELKRELGVKNPLFTTVVGNPVMLSFYLNKSVKGLARFPFESAIDKGVFLKNPARFVFPVIGGFVGGDTIAGILASGVYKKKKTSLYIDLGTNGEVVLISNRKITATSTAAGPAFEGVGLSCGCLAVPGAIERIKFRNGEFIVQTIKNQPPIGLCASGLIDLLSLLLTRKALQTNGRLPKTIRLKGLTITQADIRKLQLAVAAVHTGIQSLLSEFSIEAGELEEAVITGEFGTKVNITALQRIGLLPTGIKKVRFEKDLPLKGAISALKDDGVLAQAEEIRRMSTHIDLATLPNFQKVFVNALKLEPWN